MFIDAKDIEADTQINADLCIIGAGAAGITIAREMSGAGTDVVLLESGGLRYSRETQTLARGNVVGLRYFDLEGERVRIFGGCTDHWGGECCPFDAQDFSERPWIPHSGWPITLAQLEPYYERAAKIVEIGSHKSFKIDGWDEAERNVPALRALHFTTGNVAPRILRNSPPTRFGKRYHAELQAATNVRVLLNANFVGFETDEGQKAVTTVKVARLGGPQFTVAARVFILATGAIENARLLLAAAGREGSGFGNANGLVGRFFQDHVSHSTLAMLLPGASPLMSEYLMPEGTIAPAFTGQAQRQQQLPNATIFFDPLREGGESSGVRSFRAIVGAAREWTLPAGTLTHFARVMSDLPSVTRYVVRRVSGSEEPIASFEIGMVLEQIPNPDSRVQLGRERDALGIPVAELDLRLTDLDRQLMLRTLDRVIREIGASGLGRVKLLIPDDGGDWLERVGYSHHPAGTTRMHRDPRHGVVDEHCRVHGMVNLYVAGSSVFPTSSASSPTYTIVALAIRLADHIKHEAT